MTYWDRNIGSHAGQKPRRRTPPTRHQTARTSTGHELLVKRVTISALADGGGPMPHIGLRRAAPRRADESTPSGGKRPMRRSSMADRIAMGHNTNSSVVGGGWAHHPIRSVIKDEKSLPACQTLCGLARAGSIHARQHLEGQSGRRRSDEATNDERRTTSMFPPPIFPFTNKH